MKSVNLLLAILFAFTLCVATAPETVYSKTETKEVASSASKKASKAAKATKATKSVNINTADKETLTQLPGVGPKTADAIIKYRKANGKFKSAKDLMNVKGIGEKTLAKMKPLVKL